MELTEAEGKAFWPLYEAYQKKLHKLNDRLGKTISEYADAYNQGKGTVANDTAKKLIHEAIAVEEDEVKLKHTYADKIGKVLPAARWRGTFKSRIKSVRSSRPSSPNRFR